MATFRVPLRIVFYQSNGDWIAHCLEFDLCGHGATKVDAVELLKQAIAIQIEQSAKFSNWHNLFAPADGKYFEMFAAGTDMTLGELEMTDTASPVLIEHAEAREYTPAPDLASV